MDKKESMNAPEKKESQEQQGKLQSSRYHNEEYAKMSDGMVP